MSLCVIQIPFKIPVRSNIATAVNVNRPILPGRHVFQLIAEVEAGKSTSRKRQYRPVRREGARAGRERSGHISETSVSSCRNTTKFYKNCQAEEKATTDDADNEK
jgi:hypothetical protein